MFVIPAGGHWIHPHKRSHTC